MTKKLDSKFYTGGLFREKDGSKVPPDEFVVFLVHDKNFLKTLHFYREECRLSGCEQPQLEAVDALIERVVAWQAAHPERMKLADVEPNELNLEARYDSDLTDANFTDQRTSV
jgi:hypothetical protein